MGRMLPFVCLAFMACAGATRESREPPSGAAGPAPAAAMATPAVTAAAAPAPSTSAHLTAWKARAPDEGCQARLAALARGELAAFHGLPRCGRVDAEATLGSSGDQPSKFEQFGEYRVYMHDGGSVLVWFLADDIRVIELLYPKLRRPLKALLGEPEGKARSGLSPEWDQLIWASRGLTAHVHRSTGEVVALFAYRAMSVAAFLETDIAKVSKSEAPLEELK